MTKTNEAIILDAIFERQRKLEQAVEQLNQEVSIQKQAYNRVSKEFEQARFELDQFQRELLPRFSIVTYTPNSTEFYRASYRHLDTVQGKSVPRVVHLGPSKDFNGKDDPRLLLLAKKQIVSYLLNKFPGIYNDLISK